MLIRKSTHPARRLFAPLLVIAGGLAAYACAIDEVGSGSSPPEQVDGGVVYADGGVLYTDGGIVYIDGGFEPFDAGPSTCKDGSVPEALGAGVFGCSGSVPFPARNSLCRTDCRACTATEWAVKKAPQTNPTRNYWLADTLYRSSGEGACSVSASPSADKTSCLSNVVYEPMRVCKPTQPDPEGNACNWVGCGLGTTNNQYFGGCSGNTTAGALCCPTGAPAASGCASGANSQTFGEIAGCAGKVTWGAAGTLCAPGYTVCSAAQWAAVTDGGAATAPTHNYWTSDADLRYSGSEESCSVSTSTGTSCNYGTTVPMRVCGAGTDPDPDGNRCIAAGCGLEVSSKHTVFGGCADDGRATPDGGSDDAYTRAGTVCCCNP